MRTIIFFKRRNQFLFSFILLTAVCGCIAGGKPMALSVESKAFGAMKTIPANYTCDGKDISVPLAWTGVPQNAKSLAIIMDDPDAPMKVWVHWVVYDIPVNVQGLTEGQPSADTLPEGGVQGKNDFGKTGYGGPCPPSGTHRYFIKLYALDTILNLPPGKTKKELERGMTGHILAKAELIGTYSRK